MLINVIAWILFGAVAGWIASIIMGTDEQQGGIDTIVIGIIGAFVGGAIARWLGGSGVTDFNLGSLVVAILGSVLLIFVIRLFSGRHHGSTL